MEQNDLDISSYSENYQSDYFSKLTKKIMLMVIAPSPLMANIS